MHVCVTDAAAALGTEVCPRLLGRVCAWFLPPYPHFLLDGFLGVHLVLRCGELQGTARGPSLV